MEIIKRDFANNQTRAWVDISEAGDTQKNAVFFILPGDIKDAQILTEAKKYQDIDKDKKQKKKTLLDSLLTEQKILAARIENLKLELYGFTDKG